MTVKLKKLLLQLTRSSLNLFKADSYFVHTVVYNLILYLISFMACFSHCLDLLCDCAELCKYCRLTDSVYSQCESGDYGFSVQTTPQRWASFGITFSRKFCLLSQYIMSPRRRNSPMGAVLGAKTGWVVCVVFFVKAHSYHSANSTQKRKWELVTVREI